MTVQLFDRGGQNCRTSGFPGVGLRTDAGTVPVARNSEKAYPDTPEPGDSAAFTLQFPADDTGGSGVRPTRIVVTPRTTRVRRSWGSAGSPLATVGSGSGPELEAGPADEVGCPRGCAARRTVMRRAVNAAFTG